MRFRPSVLLRGLQYLQTKVVSRRAQRKLGLASRIESRYPSKLFGASSFFLQHSLEHCWDKTEHSNAND